MGQQLWLFCCDCADNFCTNFRPKLQAEGFLQNSNADRLFMCEAMQLHLWIISCALGIKDRDVIDVLANFAINSGLAHHQGHASKTMRDRFVLYDQAFSEDRELLAKGCSASATVLADTALQCLLQNENYERNCVISVEVALSLLSAFGAVKDVRAKFKIRET